MLRKNNVLVFGLILTLSIFLSNSTEAAFKEINFNVSLSCTDDTVQGELEFIPGAPNGNYKATFNVSEAYQQYVSIDGNSLLNGGYTKNFKIPQNESGLKFQVGLDQNYLVGLGANFDSFGIDFTVEPGDDTTSETGFGFATGTLTINNAGCNNEEPVNEEPVEVVEDEVKIQPATRNGTCPLSSLEHLDLAIKTEQALKLRIDRQSTEILNAIDAVSEAGVDPGPALRQLDALIEFIRDDIGDTRNITKSGLEFSKRHLVCARQKLSEENISFANKASAESEINQAIAGDNEAITAIMTENSEINSEAVRLQGTLENTSSKIHFALFDKEQAGESIDPGFVMPDFGSEDVNEVYEEFQTQVAALAEQLIETLEKQQDVVSENNTDAAIDAILEVQNGDSIDEFFDEVINEYTKVHTHVKEELEKIKEAAEEAAQSEEPAEDAPSPQVGKQAEKESNKLDKSFEKTVVSVNKTREKFQDTYGGLVGSEQHRTDRKIKALLELLKRAEFANDTEWRRLIRKELKKFAGFFGQGA